MTISPRVRAWLLLGGAILMVVVAVLLGRGGQDSPASQDARPAATSTAAPKPSNPGGVAKPSVSAPAKVAGVPDRAYQTLIEIDAGRWPDSANSPGTRGGEQYFNRNRALPTGNNITYREWDVNPKRRGQDRGAERIVTGSDGSAWYTADHYDTFTRMR
ncbi:ribonuclease domain-containing protein [Nocardia sp. NPDC005978]|uniref:ribonuclease domain-containing protein n=1 Tax=unclassified Nocardia TaxID=2637762 RepID=UPI0033BC2257